MGGGVAGAGQMLQVRYRTGGREEPLDGAVTEEGVGGELEDGAVGWKALYYIRKKNVSMLVSLPRELKIFKLDCGRVFNKFDFRFTFFT